MEEIENNTYNLFNNLQKCNKKENIFIIDLYNYNYDLNKTTPQESQEDDLIKNLIDLTKEYSKVDNNFAFVFLLKNFSKYYKPEHPFIKLLNDNTNIYTEEKSNHIYYNLGYLISKNINMYIFLFQK